MVPEEALGVVLPDLLPRHVLGEASGGSGGWGRSRWKLRQWWFVVRAPELGARGLYRRSTDVALVLLLANLVLGRWDLGSWRWETKPRYTSLVRAYRCCWT